MILMSNTKPKKKKRQPYRRSSRWGKRGIAFIIPLIFIALTIVILIILIKNPEICLFGKCWRLVPLRFSKGFIFWLTFLAFILLNVGLFYVYWQIGKYGSRFIKSIVPTIKKMTFNIEAWFIRTTG